MFTKYRSLSKCERRDLWPALRRLVVVRVCLLAGIKRTLAWQDRRGLAVGRTRGRSTAERSLPSANRTRPPICAGPTYKSGGLAGAVRNDERDLDIWRRRALALKRVAPRLPRTHCLARALALRGWMRSAGLNAEMKIGIRTGPDGLESHAWVELDQIPIDETPENVATYKPLLLQQAKTAPWRP